MHKNVAERTQTRLQETQRVCTLTRSASEPTQSQLRLDAATVASPEDSNIHISDLLLSKEDEASAAGEADLRHTFAAHEFRC